MSDSRAIAAKDEHSPGACPRCGAPRATPDSDLWVGYQCGSGLSVGWRWSRREPCKRRVEELESELREAMDSSHRFATEAHLLAELCREAIARLDELHAESARDLAKRLERILSEDAP